MMDVDAYVKFHGCRMDYINDNIFTIPVYQFPVTELLLKRLEFLATTTNMCEKDTVFGLDYSHIPEMRAISIFLNSPYIDLIVFRVDGEKFAWIYICHDGAYTCQPNFFNTSNAGNPAFYIHSSIYITESTSIADIPLLQETKVKIGDSNCNVIYQKLADNIITWHDPLDIPISGLDYYCTAQECSMYPNSRKLSRRRFISHQQYCPSNILNYFIQKNYKSDHVFSLELPFITPITKLFTTPEITKGITLHETFSLQNTTSIKLLYDIYKIYNKKALLLYNTNGINGINGILLNGPEFDIVIYLSGNSVFPIHDIDYYKTLLHKYHTQCNNATIHLIEDLTTNMCVYRNFIWAYIDVTGFLVIPKYASVVYDVQYQNLSAMTNPYLYTKIPFPHNVQSSWTLNKHIYLSPCKQQGFYITEKPKQQTTNIIYGEYPPDLALTSIKFVSILENLQSYKYFNDDIKIYVRARLCYIFFVKIGLPHESQISQEMKDTHEKYFPGIKYTLQKDPVKKQLCSIV
jgi:hypothetical protein